MTEHGSDPSVKLMPDGVVEAIIDLRFAHTDSPELVVAKIATMPAAKGWKVAREPAADIPAQLRRADPGLAHQTLLQMTSPEGQALKIGENIVSYHTFAPYPGWEILRHRASVVAEHLLSAISGIQFYRIGIRYLNVLNKETHGFENLSSTNLSITMNGKMLSDQININYLKEDAQKSIIVRLATPKFVQGPNPDFGLMIDLDVFTPDAFLASDLKSVMTWADDGHTYLKNEFLSLIRPDVLAKLREK